MTKTMTKTFNPATDPFDIERVEGVEIGASVFDAYAPLYEVSWDDWVLRQRKYANLEILYMEERLALPFDSIPILYSATHLPSNLPHNIVLDIMRANGWRKHDDGWEG